jgi:hypothetical protein
MGFAFRILPVAEIESLKRQSLSDARLPNALITGLGSAEELSKTAAYGGVPEIAGLGFAIARASDSNTEHGSAFLDALDRLRQRPVVALDALATDDLALLGMADGLHALTVDPRSVTMKTWLANVINSRVGSDEFSMRLRSLALDLLDERGRLRAEVTGDHPDVLALELIAQKAWPHAFVGASPVSTDARKRLFSALLETNSAHLGDVEMTALHLAALMRLFDDAAAATLPTIDDLVRILRDTQTSLKRWVWQTKGRRSGAEPARWLIDAEPHVQAFLWAVLYPSFREDLRDEQYLKGFGLKQPRYDLAVLSLQTIIEVKFVREIRDFEEVEEQIAGDLGLYFADPRIFARMVVYVYDDSDEAAPERYDILRNALRARDGRIHDVVVVRRPSMMPGRKKRADKGISTPA